MARVKPTTTKGQVDHLWMDIRGTNGNGIVDRVARIEQNMLTGKDLEIAMLKTAGKRTRPRATKANDWTNRITLAVLVATFVIGTLGLRNGWFLAELNRLADTPVEVVE